MQTVVIGAGVVGVSIAARLAERGASVTVVDQGAPGGGTTSTSYAWVNANGKEPQPYYDLNLAGLEAHRAMSAGNLATGRGSWLGTGGHVEIAVDDTHRDHLAGRLARLTELGYGAEVVTHERAAALLPDVRVPDAAQLIVHFTREAYAYPTLYLAHMLGRARAAGVRVLTGATVTGLRPSASGGGEVLLDDGTLLAGSTIVSAVGRWTGELAALAGADVPMQTFASPGDPTVGYLAETGPVPVRLDRLVTSPWLNVRPAGGGRLLLQALDLDTTADPTDVPGPASPLAEEFLRRLRDVLPGAEGARIERLVVGQRALPGDGRTIVGRTARVPWLYVVATHSGVTLAPYLGDGVASEIYGEQVPAFAEFRPERFHVDAAYEPVVAPRRPGEQ
ncbi:NAD(P)/FAD-dependent oxidoreductase [Promicromonospora vindobonensis]|uniref:NAD(P)/FAD-dependent oxidoreductase n=1 Tax=Promicromonospora vindobonensis TaxID=195748 RepID=A0ABW5VYB1_9MICO